MDGVTELGGEVFEIDTLMGGHAGITAGYLIRSDRPCLVETGTALSAPTVVEALARLGVGTEDVEVFAHRVFHLVVVRQRGAGGQTHFTHGAALGGAPLEPLFHNDAGRGGGNFGCQGVRNRHGGTLAASAADIVA